MDCITNCWSGFFECITTIFFPRTVMYIPTVFTHRRTYEEIPVEEFVISTNENRCVCCRYWIQSYNILVFLYSFVSFSNVTFFFVFLIWYKYHTLSRLALRTSRTGTPLKNATCWATNQTWLGTEVFWLNSSNCKKRKKIGSIQKKYQVCIYLPS